MAKKVQKAKPKQKSYDFSVVGIQYRVTLPYRRRLAELTPFPVRLVREPENPHDENAIAVTIAAGTFINGMKIGYLRREVAAVLAPALDEGVIAETKAELTTLDPEISEAVAEIWLIHAENLALDKIQRR
jgi:HIRAN domain